MLRSLSMLALVALLVACSESTGPRYAAVSDARIRIVAGDSQVAAVATSEDRAGSLVPGSYTLAQGPAGDYDLFPEVLEVVLVASSDGAARGGTSGDPVPPGTDVHWIVRDDGCGRPVGQTTSTDESGRAVNRWIRGTVARDCRMDVCRILGDGALACDTTFTAVQLHGPPVRFQTTASPRLAWIGQRFELQEVAAAWDLYGNRIPTDSITWTHPAPVYAPTTEGADTITITIAEFQGEVVFVAMTPLQVGTTIRARCDDGDVPWSPGIPPDSAMMTYTITTITGGGVGVLPDGEYSVVFRTEGIFEHHLYRPGIGHVTRTDPAYSVVFDMRLGGRLSTSLFPAVFTRNDGGGYTSTDPHVCTDATLIYAEIIPPSA